MLRVWGPSKEKPGTVWSCIVTSHLFSTSTARYIASCAWYSVETVQNNCSGTAPERMHSMLAITHHGLLDCCDTFVVKLAATDQVEAHRLSASLCRQTATAHTQVGNGIQAMDSLQYIGYREWTFLGHPQVPRHTVWDRETVFLYPPGAPQTTRCALLCTRSLLLHQYCGPHMCGL